MAVTGLPSSMDVQREHRLRASLAFALGEIETMRWSSLGGLLVAGLRLQDVYLPSLDLMLAAYELGHHDLSLTLAQSLLATRVERSGREHRRSAGLLRYVGLNLLRLGRLEDARVALDEASRIRHRVLGPEHHETAFTDLGLAELSVADGELESARTKAMAALALLSRTLPAHHFEHRRQALAMALTFAGSDPCLARDILSRVTVPDSALVGLVDVVDRWSERVQTLRDELAAAPVTCPP